MQNVFFIRSFLCEKLQWPDWGGALRVITPPSKKTLPFLKEHKNEIIPFALLHLKFCSAIEKCYYLAILLKMSIGAAKIIYCELFKDKGYSRLLLWCKLWQFCFLVFIFEFSLTQPLWFSTPFGKSNTFNIREWGFRIRTRRKY